jgi:hypothetical protein
MNMAENASSVIRVLKNFGQLFSKLLNESDFKKNKENKEITASFPTVVIYMLINPCLGSKIVPLSALRA